MTDEFDEALRNLARLLKAEGAPRGFVMTRLANNDVLVSLASVDPDVPSEVPYARIHGRTGVLTHLIAE